MTEPETRTELRLTGFFLPFTKRDGKRLFNTYVTAYRDEESLRIQSVSICLKDQTEKEPAEWLVVDTSDTEPSDVFEVVDKILQDAEVSAAVGSVGG